MYILQQIDFEVVILMNWSFLNYENQALRVNSFLSFLPWQTSKLPRHCKNMPVTASSPVQYLYLCIEFILNFGNVIILVLNLVRLRLSRQKVVKNDLTAVLFDYYFIKVLLSLGMNTKILNLELTEHGMSEHQTFQTSHFGPKSIFEHVEHHKKLNSSQTSNCMFQD